MTLEYFPKDTVILAQGRQVSEALYIVQKGAVKLGIRTNVGKELVLDMRSEGEVFGLLSLMGRDVARLDVVAPEDTLCYTIPGEEVQRLIERHREVSEYFVRTSITRYMDRSLTELRTQVNLMGNAEQLLYSLSVADVVRCSALVCDETTTICEAAKRISNEKSAALLVTDADGRAAGVVTDRDFAKKLVAGGVLTHLPVTAIMTAPVIEVESSERIFQALLTMLGRDILYERLAASITEQLKNASFFKSILACIPIGRKPPLGFFRTFVLDRSGNHKEELDIKETGTGPIVDATRLFAADRGVSETNTVDRLTALRA
jgi:CBS domain-containing protein